MGELPMELPEVREAAWSLICRWTSDMLGHQILFPLDPFKRLNGIPKQMSFEYLIHVHTVTTCTVMNLDAL